MSRMHEDQIYRLQPLEPGCVQLVQITDCHILASAEQSLRGMNTRQSFEAVKSAVLGDRGNIDLLLATGDLTQDGSASAYRYLAAQFEDLGAPSFWLPGNHDEIQTLRQNFVGRNIHPAKQVLVGSWLIVLLDSTIAGEVHGRVRTQQLDFMDNALQRHADKHALVCLHHQAQASGSLWIDAIGLRDAGQFRQRLTRHANLRGVLWGHVHQEAHQTIDNVEWMSTPSSCMQFKPGSPDFALGAESPGYRRLRLNADGSITTSVHRVRI